MMVWVDVSSHGKTQVYSIEHGAVTIILNIS